MIIKATRKEGGFLMEIATFIISMINFIGIVIAGIIYFNNNYEILPKEVYQVLADTYEKTSKEEQASQELAGGIAVGFGADYLEDEEE